jgi:hypothetical protein
MFGRSDGGNRLKWVAERWVTHKLATAVVGWCLLAGAASAEPLFENSVVSNDIDFLVASDPAVPACLHFVGLSVQEMPGALDTDELMASDVYQFNVTFLDDSEVGIWVHPSVGSRVEAERLAGLLLGPLGRLPSIMRQRLSHVVVHSGYHAAFGEHLGHFFVVYADNIQSRIDTHDLEETVFHESVHATLDADWAQSAEWLEAQQADGQFVTDYAAEKPAGEDLAETALFALTYLRHRDRLPPEVVNGLETMIPARLAFFETIFSAPEPDLTGAELPENCLAQ